MVASKNSTSSVKPKSRASSTRSRGRNASAKPKRRSAGAVKSRGSTRSRSRVSRTGASKSRAGASKSRTGASKARTGASKSRSGPKKTTNTAAVKPKTSRPTPGYQMYVREQLANKNFEGQEEGLRAAVREAASSWKTLSDEEKDKYEEQANKANTKSGRTGKSKTAEQ